MDRWSNKVAVVTGASSGIGSAVALALANAGMIVVGFARRQERVDELKTRLPGTAKGSLHSFKCDVQNEDEVVAAFAWVVQKFGGVDVLINNAGISKPGRLTGKDHTPAIREVIATNILGVVLCTREAYASMTSRNVDGHIVLINSILGHNVLPVPGSSLSIYPSTKFAVTAMTEVLRQEFQADGNKIKVTSISPGWVNTEIVPEYVKKNIMPLFLESEDLAEAVLYVLGTPPRVQVHELIIRPNGDRIFPKRKGISKL